MSVRSVTASSSKKRKVIESRCVSGFEIDDTLKQEVIQKFVAAITNNILCELICDSNGITGWREQIREAILYTQYGIPSPSSMRYEDVPRILHGSIPTFRNPNVQLMVMKLK